MNAYSIRQWRKLLLAAPLLAAVAWGLALPRVGSAEVSEAAPAQTVEVDAVADDMAFTANNCTYYNNASHSQVVGQFGTDCCNNPVAWGRKTRYYVCGGCFPCYPPPPW